MKRTVRNTERIEYVFSRDEVIAVLKCATGLSDNPTHVDVFGNGSARLVYEYVTDGEATAGKGGK